MSAPDPIYLDHNATTPVLRVVEAMLAVLREHFGNPSSGHVYGAVPGRRWRRGHECGAARLRRRGVLFTSGAEAQQPGNRRRHPCAGDRRHIVTTEIEHPGTARPCASLERRGWRVTRVGVDAYGRARLGEARAAISQDTALVTVMHSNNETGVLQPVAELAALAHAAGALVHADAAQSVGKVPVRVREREVDLLSVAGHKAYAPKGVGALYVRPGTPLAPVVLGASHERGLRPGTENVASIVGLGAACELVGRDLEATAARLRALRERLHQQLTAAIPGLGLNGHPTLRLPNTLNVRFPRAPGAAVLEGAPEVAASTGSACHEGQQSASAIILAMGVAPADALGSVRLTLGRGTTEEDVDRAARALVESWRRLAG
jgi:cysteine desulfurase